MAEGKRWYLVAYDVRDPKRLRRTAKHLKGYGERVQFSVFRCRLSVRKLERLRWELARILAAEDGLLVVGLCAACAAKVRARNPEAAWPPDPDTFAIV